MASRIDTGNPRRLDPRLYLISPEVEHPAAFADTLAAALAGAEVAASPIRPDAVPRSRRLPIG